jgi:hypothetical protein
MSEAAPSTLVTRVAWLLWCFQEGYIAAEDRVGMTNWLEEDPRQLHPDDQALWPQLLALANEVIAAVREDNRARRRRRRVVAAGTPETPDE